MLSIIFGGPALVAGLGLFLVGLAIRRVWVAAIGLIVSTPFFVYVAMNPLPFRLLAPLSIASAVLALVAQWRKRQVLASLLATPPFMLLAYIVARIQGG